MRTWLPAVGLLLACGKEAVRPVEAPAVASPVAPPVVPPPAEGQTASAGTDPLPLPPIAALATSQTFHVVEVDGTKARCQPWAFDADRSVLIATKQLGKDTVTEQLALSITGAQLTITSIERDHGDDRGASSTTCHTVLHATPAPTGLVLGDAVWFASADACATAVREHRRVAMDFQCDLPADVPAKLARATRSRFEGLLARGGAVFSIVDGPRGHTCKRVRVVPDGPQRDVLEGSFEWAVVREDDGVKGTMSLGYTLARGSSEMSLTGPGATFKDGSGFGVGCLGHATVVPHVDHVMLDEAVYFTQAACRAAIQRVEQRASWFALPNDESLAGTRTTEGDPSLGGC